MVAKSSFFSPFYYFQELCEKYFDNFEFVDFVFVLLKSHSTRRDVVVRATFCLGNLAAKCDASRLHLAKHPDIVSTLILILKGEVSVQQLTSLSLLDRYQL